MFKSIKTSIKNLIAKSGWELIKSSILENIRNGIPSDFNISHVETYNKVKDYTMTNVHRIVAICDAIDYLEENGIQGEIVACGVWRGGVVMAGIDTLQHNKSAGRDIYLYDTFEGMTTPSHQYDVKKGGHSGVGKTAEEIYKNATAEVL